MRSRGHASGQESAGIEKSRLRHPISETEKRAFAEDGAVCLRRQFDAGWVERLRDAAEEVFAPGWHTINYTPTGQPGRYISSLFMWRMHPEFRAFVYRSPAAAIAGELLGATKINLFADQLLFKEPGTPALTHWHHDLPYWPLAGTQVCSIWLALDPVTRETGRVEYVAGSHRWGMRFRPLQATTGELVSKRNMDLPACPDISAQRDRHRILSWDLAPGDCVVFHALTLHGSAGNASPRLRRRGFATRWCGDDVTFLDGDFVMVTPPPRPVAGGPLDSEIFPVVWRGGR